MQITTSNGTIHIDENAHIDREDGGDIDRMNAIIDSMTSTDERFQAMCDASTKFPHDTFGEFHAACLEYAGAKFGGCE